MTYTPDQIKEMLAQVPEQQRKAMPQTMTIIEELLVERERLREALSGLIDATIKDSKENNSMSGFTGARLKDAQSALSGQEK